MKLIKKLKDEMVYIKSFKGEYTLENRAKGYDTFCYVLAGYKEYLWDVVFKRLYDAAKNYDIDICILSSGLYSSKLSKLCEKNNWSYLSTKRNNLCLIQNITMDIFCKAEWIFKLDEDMFVPSNYFSRMKNAYIKIDDGKYDIGCLAPLIPMNSYGTPRIMEILDLEKIYREKFGDCTYGWSQERSFYNNPEVALFLWGDTGTIPRLTQLDELLKNKDFSYKPCPVQFNIGAILFTRSYWKILHHFKVNYIKRRTGMGMDEDKINMLKETKSKAILVCDNIVVGHFSFTPQNERMKELYNQKKELFV